MIATCLLYMYNEYVNSKRKGNIAIAGAISHFVKNGLTVLIPVSDCDKYDMCVDNAKDIDRIQCKYTSEKEPSGAYTVDLRTFGGYRKKTYHNKYVDNDFDYLFVYCENGDKYLIPSKKIIDKSRLVLGIRTWNEYKC